MESVYHFVTIRVNETSWAHVWRLRSCYLGTGYDNLTYLMFLLAGHSGLSIATGATAGVAA
jgi:hypothetical protein